MDNWFASRRYYRTTRREMRARRKRLKKQFKQDPAYFDMYNKETPR